MTTPSDGPGHARAASLSLVEALETDPFYVSITRDFSDDAARRRDVLRAYFEYAIEEAATLGCSTVLPDDPRGAAIWTRPVPHDIMSRSKLEKHRFLGSTLGRDGLADYHSIIGFMSPRSEPVVGSDAWYLSILGVSPSARGRGLGRRLLEPTLDEADRAKADCYLETFSSRALPFYERLGFRRVASHVEPVTSSEYWIMVRRPGGADTGHRPCGRP